jgi:very-short-patch-repair endonuclease
MPNALNTASPSNVIALDRADPHLARARIRRIFQFLDAYVQLRNPVVRRISEQPWTLWLRDLPQSPSVTRPAPEKPEERFIFKLRRPAATPCPRPPHELEGWLLPGWDQPGAEPRARDTLETVEGARTQALRFADERPRTKAFEKWKAERAAWESTERPERAALELFERLYALHGQIEREAEKIELLVGDGILHWRVEEGAIHHPILLKRVELAFNPETPEFILAETDNVPELYTALFSASRKVDGRMLQNRIEEIERHFYHPLDPEATTYLKGVLGSLGGGELIPSGKELDGESDIPRIARDPVVFARLRSIGVGSTIKGILEDIETAESFPPSLMKIVGLNGHSEDEAAPAQGDAAPANEDAEVLFAKEANIEQLNLAKRLRGSGAVIVQGPPGTGKTHTIGNLIGHLLAHGKSILVTSHTTKALRVLRDQAHPDIQPLCVSVLDSDARGRQELEISVSKISERLSRDDAGDLSRVAADREKQRAMLIAQLRELRERLRAAVSAEYREIDVGPQSFEPSQAARRVAGGRGVHDWIPAPVGRCAEPPLAEAELGRLYGSNSTLTPGEEQELHLSVPEPAELLTPVQFSDAVESIARHGPYARKLREDLWNDVDRTLDTRELGRLLAQIDKALEFVTAAEKWRLHAVNAGIAGGADTEPWRALIELVNRARSLSSQGSNLILKHGPLVTQDYCNDVGLAIIDEILKHLGEGGRLGGVQLMLNPRWKAFKRSARVGDVEPFRAEHFEALRAAIRIGLIRRELVARWERQMTALGAAGADQLGEEPERICAQFLPQLEDALNWYPQLLKPAIEGLKLMGFNWERLLREVTPPLDAVGELRRLERAVRQLLQPVVRARLARQIVDENEALLAKLRPALSKYPHDHDGLVGELLAAARKSDVDLYRRGFAKLAELNAKRQTLADRLALLSRLDAAAPAWATAIRSRDGRHGGTALPGDVAEAWLWRQLADELAERRKEEPAAIQARIEELAAKLREVTVELIEARAWGNQLKKAAKYRQSLIGWLDTQRRLGAKSGEKARVAELIAESRKLMSESQAAVPVWIMPLVRIYENFDVRRTRFDVVIVDEASQCGLEGLIALYLGRQVVIVGDHEQVSPDSFGMEQAPVERLIKMILKGIPNSHLYDGKLSIYDLGRQAFGDTIRLIEHFRCVPEIVQFSNELSYNGDIRPLRESSAGGLAPALVPYRVSGGRDGQVNREETLAVASLVLAMCRHEAYRSKTLGVISLLAEQQAYAIDQLLRRHLPPAEYERRRIICGNAAQFQGDERDVMVLSVVDGPKDESPLALRQAGANDMFKKRYNVAASRARDQMWVVHSLDSKSDLKPGDLRRRLIEHALDPAASMGKLEDGAVPPGSDFERRVAEELSNRGYRVAPQWKVGKYRIDLVVLGAKGRLAIECDGDRYLPLEKIPEAMARQAVLERLGWKFERIRSSEFLVEPERAMAPVLARLASLGIVPGRRSEAEGEPGRALVEEITRLAREIRAGLAPERIRLAAAPQESREPAAQE